MAKKFRVIAHVMHENEIALASGTVDNPQVTEAFVLGEADEAQIEKLKGEGLVVQTLGEVGAAAAEAPETPGIGAMPLPNVRKPMAYLGRLSRREVQSLPKIDLTRPNVYLIQIAGPLLPQYRAQLEQLDVTLMESYRSAYTRITNQIVAELEKSVVPWLKPWNAEHAAGRITRPLRANGIPYRGINILMLWSEAVEKGFSAPIWMTFKQTLELNAHVRKGEKGSLVVYASSITRTETNADTGEEAERDISFMKGYTRRAPWRSTPRSRRAAPTTNTISTSSRSSAAAFAA